MERGFRDGVVPAISLAAHALDAAMMFQLHSEIAAGKIPLSLWAIRP